MNWFRWDEQALYLRIQVQPGASRSEFAGMHGGLLKIRIHAPAVAGKANVELCDFLCRSFATPKSAITIEHGEHGRMKQVRIQAPRQLPESLLQTGLRAPP
ncbi:MAG: DUF167 family protein [Steroidobacteraceae bacterium]